MIVNLGCVYFTSKRGTQITYKIHTAHAFYGRLWHFLGRRSLWCSGPRSCCHFALWRFARGLHLFDLLPSLSWGSWSRNEKSQVGVLWAIFGLQTFLSGWQGTGRRPLVCHLPLPVLLGIHLAVLSGSQGAPGEQIRWHLKLVSKEWAFHQDFLGPGDPSSTSYHFSVLGQI